jgi:hypothetical protein
MDWIETVDVPPTLRWKDRRHPGCSIEDGIRLLDLGHAETFETARQHQFCTFLMVMAIHQRAFEFRIDPDDRAVPCRPVFELDTSDGYDPPEELIEALVAEEIPGDGGRITRELKPIPESWAPPILQCFRWIARLDSPRILFARSLRRLAATIDGGSIGTVCGRFRVMVGDVRADVTLAIEGIGLAERFRFRFGPIQYPPSPFADAIGGSAD